MEGSITDTTTDTPLAEAAAAETPRPYLLRESTVPASRLSRLWNYGGLAAGMLGGAIAESISRAAGGSGEGPVDVFNLRGRSEPR